MQRKVRLTQQSATVNRKVDTKMLCPIVLTLNKEFNWIASRRVFTTKLSRRSESDSCQIVPSGIIAAQADYAYLWSLVCANTFGLRAKRIIKPKSTLVETRKMVNYARTW